MALAIREVHPRRRDFVAHLATLVTPTGAPLPPHTKQALTREHERLSLVRRQIREIEAAQAAPIRAAAANRLLVPVPTGREPSLV